MNRKVFVAVTILLFTSLPTAPVLAGVTPISECGTVITTPGKYKLVQDLLLCPDEPLFGPPLGVITVASSGVDLNLQGHTITCDFVDDVIPSPAASTNAGVLVQPGFSNVNIKNGSISGCNDGVVLINNSNSSVKDMTVTGNRVEFGPLFFGTGISVIGGNNIELKKNHAAGNENQGILVFEGDGNTIRANTVTQNIGTGIEAFFESNTKYICNQSNQNGRGGIALSGMGGDNLVRGNVANENGATGITMFGRSDLPPGQQPIPEDNSITQNVALGNAFFDLTENLFNVITGIPSLEDGAPCRNDWSNNEFGTEFGPEMCIGAPVALDDDVCALD